MQKIRKQALNSPRWIQICGCCASLFLATIAAAQAQAPVCLSTRDMVRSEPDKEGAAITFTMRDGSQWRNDLQGRCNDLTFNGFTWILRNPDQSVCENQQSLRVIQSGQVCQLGKFTPIKPAAGK